MSAVPFNRSNCGRNINTVVPVCGEGDEDGGDKALAHPSRTIPSNSTAGLPWRLQ